MLRLCSTKFFLLKQMRIALITLKAYLFCSICVVVLIILTVSIATIDLKIKAKIFILKIPLIKGDMISTRFHYRVPKIITLFYKLTKSKTRKISSLPDVRPPWGTTVCFRMFIFNPARTPNCTSAIFIIQLMLKIEYHQIIKI